MIKPYNLKFRIMSSTTQGHDPHFWWYKPAITLTSSAMAYLLQGFFGEHSFYLECTLLIPKTSGQRKMPQTYKMGKRDKEEQEKHSFLFLNQSSFRLEGTVCGMHHLSVCVHKVHLHTRLTSRLLSCCRSPSVIRHFRQIFLYIFQILTPQFL